MLSYYQAGPIAKVLCFVLLPDPSGDELENIIGGVRNEVKSAGMQDTRENCWSFFIERVRRQLKVGMMVMCDVCGCVCVHSRVNHTCNTKSVIDLERCYICGLT